MDRREFVGNLIGSSIITLTNEIPSLSLNNPKNLPVAEFENGECSNYKELLQNSPWKYCDLDIHNKEDYIYRKVTCWIPKKDAAVSYQHGFELSWGEIELREQKWL